jgi:quercetin dioxygenase-like cupin family protein
MKIFNYHTITSINYDNAEIKGVTARIVIGKEQGAENFCMRIFTFSPGGFTRRHMHDWEHEMFIHEGSCEIFSNGEWFPVVAGNALIIPANEEHQIRNNSNELLTVVCLVPSKAPEL